jgi:hypothetical protein
MEKSSYRRLSYRSSTVQPFSEMLWFKLRNSVTMDEVQQNNYTHYYTTLKCSKYWILLQRRLFSLLKQDTTL